MKVAGGLRCFPWIVMLLWVLVGKRMESYHSFAGITNVILLCPAGGAGPSAAKGALPEIGIRIWAAAEIAEVPGETSGIPVRIFPLFPYLWNIFPDTGYQVLFP